MWTSALLANLVFAETFSEWLGQKLLIVVFVICFYIWLANKYLANNPKVKDAAKNAVSNKLIDWISRWSK